MKQKAIKKSHAKYSASGAERYFNCAASIQHCENIPEPPDSPASIEGTRAHECYEAFLKAKAGQRTKVRQFLLKTYPREMVDHAEDAYWATVELLEGKHVERHSEMQLDTSHFTMPGQFGTSDAVLIEWFSTLIIADFKYGKKVVEPRANLQAITYGLAALKRFGKDFETVKLAIIQPRALHRDGPVRVWTTTPEALVKWEPKFRNAVRRCEAPSPKFKAGSWCFFCRGKETCPEKQSKWAKEALEDFDDIDCE